MSLVPLSWPYDRQVVALQRVPIKQPVRVRKQAGDRTPPACARAIDVGAAISLAGGLPRGLVATRRRLPSQSWRRPTPQPGEQLTSNHVYKLIELVGSSTTGTDDAIRNAIETAALTLRHIDWFQVMETRGQVVDGRIGRYQVTLKVGFRLTPEGASEDDVGGSQESGVDIVASRAWGWS